MPNLLLKMPPRLAAKMRRAIRADEDETMTISVEGCDPRDLEEAEGQRAPRSEQRLTLLMGEERYPAALMNLPCNIEAMKTFDGRTYFKSSDIGQALLVYETEESRDEDLAVCETLEVSFDVGDASGAGADEAPKQRKPRKEKRYYHSGLTPPTVDIVRRRFAHTRYWEGDQQRFEPVEVRDVCEELEQFLPPIRKGRKNKGEADEPVLDEAVYETVINIGDLAQSHTAATRKRSNGADPTLGVDGNADIREVPLEQLLESYPAFARYLLPAEVLQEVDKQATDAQAPEVTQFHRANQNPSLQTPAAARGEAMDLVPAATEAPAPPTAPEQPNLVVAPAPAAAASTVDSPGPVAPPQNPENIEDILFEKDFNNFGDFGTFDFTDDAVLEGGGGDL